jgi:hypothetical protein
MRVFPVTAAIGIDQSGIMLGFGHYTPTGIGYAYAGKLNGAILAQTPSGNFRTSVSMSLLTASKMSTVKPRIRAVGTLDFVAEQS